MTLKSRNIWPGGCPFHKEVDGLLKKKTKKEKCQSSKQGHDLCSCAILKEERKPFFHFLHFLYQDKFPKTMAGALVRSTKYHSIREPRILKLDPFFLFARTAE